MKNKTVKVFGEICRVKNVGPTSASKILHLLRPNLFVMWDADIAKKFSVSMSPEGYLNFLEKCRDMLKEILEQYRQNGISDPESYLSDKFGKPLTKLLDEYNWLSTRKWIRSTSPYLMQLILINKKKDPHFKPRSYWGAGS